MLAAFYAEHAGGSARMVDLVEALKFSDAAKAGAIQTAADEWLTELACPIDDFDELCDEEE